MQVLDDMGAPDAAPPDAGPLDPCGLEPLGDDTPRTVLIGHRFGEEIGEVATEIRSLVLRADGAIVDVGTRLDLGDQPAQIAVSPFGRVALVAGEEGSVTVVDIQDPADLQILDVAAVPRAGVSDLIFDPGGQTAFLVRSDVDEATAGIYTLHLACDGTLTVDPEHFGLRLAKTLTFLPDDPDRAVLLGGQTAFDPIDDDDVRLLERRGDGWQQIGAFDIYSDLVDAAGVAVNAAGDVLVPNGLSFSEEAGQVAVCQIEGDTITETNRLLDLPEAHLARMAPDGQTALLLRPAEDRISVLSAAEGWGRVDDLVLGLATDFAMLDNGLALVPTVRAGGGSRVTVLRVDGPGAVGELDHAELGRGNLNIPGPVGVRP